MKTSTHTRSTIRATLIAGSLMFLACAGTLNSAMAADSPAPLNKTVVYGDLNLDSEQGAKILYLRLRHAAEYVCTPFQGREPERMAHWHACFDQALTAAVAQVNKSRVTALHNQMSAHAGRI